MRGLDLSRVGPVEVMGGVFHTGSFLVLLESGDPQEGLAALRQAGLAVASTADSATGVLTAADLAGVDGVLFDELGVAVVEVDPGRAQALGAAAASAGAIAAVEPERYVFALEGEATPEYLRGYRDGVADLVDRLIARPAPPAPPPPAPPAPPGQFTWGLEAVGVPRSDLGGKGVKVAVLDTGFDLKHPDFVGRTILAESFVEGEPPQDGHGHGTHVTGTACGPAKPETGPRYGIAHAAEILVGKVLNNQGRGGDRTVLGGINWAVRNGAAIVSMSLGTPVEPGEIFSKVFEEAAARALRKGTVLIAAAGNDSMRDQGITKPVAHPANCPSIAAVAALDERLDVAPFSNQGINPEGGQVDIAAPGVRVYSSWPMTRRYGTISGTSMATPHVSGVAALIVEGDPGAVGTALLAQLLTGARRLEHPSVDVGAGLVQAP